jgi:hypothetical protein
MIDIVMTENVHKASASARQTPSDLLSPCGVRPFGRAASLHQCAIPVSDLAENASPLPLTRTVSPRLSAASGDPLVPTQTRDVAATVAKPKCKP